MQITFQSFRSSMLSLLGTFLVIACSQAAGPTLSAPAALERAQAGELTLIDIRTPMEWRQTGVPAPAHPIAMQHPKGMDGFIAEVERQVDGDRDAPIALICRTGNRSGYMQRELMARGFSSVLDISEGMAGSSAGPGWLGRGLPVRACKDC